MSWQASVTLEPGENLTPGKFNKSNVDEVPEHGEQFNCAVSAAQAVLENGCIGDPDSTRYSVTIGGHGNTGHKPTPGWANDYVSIQVVQVGDVE